ncbi:MAG: hypothetical protein JWR35_1776 [Marmoricola sp.]|nr:hypothetical protein [Marmoricola sp.]
MAELATRLEISKLARELGVPDEDLRFLETCSVSDIRDLRTSISTALFLRHDAKFRRVAGLSRLLPGPIIAKIAELAIGPLVSARVAAVMEPGDAVRLVERLNPAFLTEVSLRINPVQVAPIIKALPEKVIVEVGRRVLAREEFIALGSFVSVVDVSAALQVVAEATGLQLLRIALYTEDHAALDKIIDKLPGRAHASVMTEAADAGAYDEAATMLHTLSEASRALFTSHLAALDADSRVAFATALAGS